MDRKNSMGKREAMNISLNNIKDLCPNNMIKVVRTVCPNPVRDKIFTEMPMTIEKGDIKITRKLFCGFAWEGGPYHDFIKGFGFSPYTKYFKISLKTIHSTKTGCVNIVYEKVFIKIKLEEHDEHNYWKIKDGK